jgi:hypothetical protein
MSDTALKHIEHLAVTLGPRGSTTAKEKAGHDYVQNVLNELGCATRVEEFQSSTSAYLPFMLSLGLMLVAEVIFYALAPSPNAQVGALAALALGVVTTVSGVMELLLRDNPLRWLVPMAQSQNVIGITPASGEAKRKLVIMAHVDSHRTPLLWRTPNTYLSYRVLSSLSFVSLLALNVIFVVGLIAPNPGLRNASLIPAAVIGLMWLLLLQGHNTPFTAGANDNASGVGVLLALAERVQREPLANSEVWWVASGCEEVQVYGSADFLRRHHDELAQAEGALISVDSIAGAGADLVYLRQEGLLLPMRYPTGMLAIADKLAADHPDLKARAFALQGANTDAAHALQAGLSALSLLSFTRRGWIPNWHNPSDVFANVDADAVDRAERFVWEVLKRLDTAPLAGSK